jgi:putative tributyrin esterase
MSFCQLHWFSKILAKQTTTWIILPDGLQGPFAAFYLLHGLSDDHTIWMRRTRIEMYVENKPLIVVMPDGGRGFYTNHENGPKWAEHIGVELPTMIEKTFPAIAERKGRFIGGLSMGGYGAMRVGLGYPDRFASVNSHSGALRFGGRAEEIPERQLMVGSNPAGSDHDLVELAKRAKEAGNLPRLRIDCGVDDFLLEDNRSLHQSLIKLKVPHEYEEFPGVHNWDYWDLHVREAIEFHLPAGVAASAATGGR